MYFWDLDSLRFDLLKGSLSSSAFAIYTVLFLIYLSLMIFPVTLSGLSGLIYVITIVTFIAGVVYCFTKNKGQNDQFLKRFIALHWVIKFRIIIKMLIPIFILNYAINDYALLLIIRLAINVYIYYSIADHIDDIANESVKFSKWQSKQPKIS